jgi:hypothetical protein
MARSSNIGAEIDSAHFVCDGMGVLEALVLFSLPSEACYCVAPFAGKTLCSAIGDDHWMCKHFDAVSAVLTVQFIARWEIFVSKGRL